MNPVLLLVLLAIAIFAVGMMRVVYQVRQHHYIKGLARLVFLFLVSYLWAISSALIAGIIVMLLFFAGVL